MGYNDSQNEQPIEDCKYDDRETNKDTKIEKIWIWALFTLHLIYTILAPRNFDSEYYYLLVIIRTIIIVISLVVIHYDIRGAKKKGVNPLVGWLLCIIFTPSYFLYSAIKSRSISRYTISSIYIIILIILMFYYFFTYPG